MLQEPAKERKSYIYHANTNQKQTVITTKWTSRQKTLLEIRKDTL